MPHWSPYENEVSPRPVHPLPILFLVVLASLLALGAHHLAKSKIALTSDEAGSFLKWSTEANRKLALIDAMHQHPSWSILYFLFALGLLSVLLLRRSPRWAVWLTVGILLIPAFGYGVTCLDITARLWR